MSAKLRLQLVRKLSRVHPGEISSSCEHGRLAHYTGGMVDNGDLNWSYCLFKATIQELQNAVRDFKNQIEEN